MIRKKLFAVLLSCFFILSLVAQKPLQVDADLVVKRITVLPPTVEELHSIFTAYTKFGEESRLAELTDPPLFQLKRLICSIHDSTIREIMRKAPRKDMVDSVQYEDERWKLALRPLLGADMKPKLLKADASASSTVMKIFEMQNIFDWVAYYKEEEMIKKDTREKEGSISGENNITIAKAKLQLGILGYKKQQQLWINRYDKYAKGFLLLPQLLEEINYGAGLTVEEKKIVIPVLADVQARALEAIEKLVWNEMSIVISGDLLFLDERILNMYAE